MAEHLLTVVLLTLAQTPPTEPLAIGPALALAGPGTTEPGALLDLAQHDPLELVSLARQRGATGVHDYSCVFSKTERVGGRLQPRATYRVKYRVAPRTVYMETMADRPRVKRLLYEAGRKIDRTGNELMTVEPGGWQRMLVSQADIPVRDPRVLETNRTTVDQFGFHSVLDRFWSVSQRARARGDLEIAFGGEGTIDGRPTLIVTRNLPHAETYPFARVVMHLDREWLMPVAVDCFADHAGTELLGSYRSTRVRINHLDDMDFEF